MAARLFPALPLRGAERGLPARLCGLAAYPTDFAEFHLETIVDPLRLVEDDTAASRPDLLFMPQCVNGIESGRPAGGRVAEDDRATARIAGPCLPRMTEHVFDVSRGQVVFVDVLNVSVRFVVPNYAQELHRGTS